jgi:hypothetical protein
MPDEDRRSEGPVVRGSEHAAANARRRLGEELARLRAVQDALIGERLAEETEAASVAELSTIDQHQADLGTETFERERDLSLLQDMSKRSSTFDERSSGSTAASTATARHAAPRSPTNASPPFRPPASAWNTRPPPRSSRVS